MGSAERLSTLSNRYSLDPEAFRKRLTVPVLVWETAPAPERTPVYKKWWLWTIVGAVVVAAVVVPVAVIEGSSDWANLPPQGPGAPATAGLKVRW